MPSQRYPMTVMTYHQAAVYCRHVDGARAPAQQSTLLCEQDKGFGCFVNRMMGSFANTTFLEGSPPSQKSIWESFDSSFRVAYPVS